MAPARSVTEPFELESAACDVEDRDVLVLEREVDELELVVFPPDVGSVGAESFLSSTPSPSVSGFVGSVPSAHSWPFVSPSPSGSALALLVAFRLPKYVVSQVSLRPSPSESPAVTLPGPAPLPKV